MDQASCIKTLSKSDLKQQFYFDRWSTLVTAYLGDGKSYNKSIVIHQRGNFQRN